MKFTSKNPSDDFFTNIVAKQNEVNGTTADILGQRDLELATFLLMDLENSHKEKPSLLPPGHEYGATWEDWMDLRYKMGRIAGEPPSAQTS